MLPGVKDPAKIAALQQEFMNDVNKAEQAFGQLGPQQAEDIRKWAVDALNIGKQAFVDRINALGDEFQKANDDLLAKVKPAFDAFAGIVGDTGTKIGDVGGDFDRLGPPPIDRVRVNLNGLADDIDAFRTRVQKADVKVNANVDLSISRNSDGTYYTQVRDRRTLYGAA
jgi:hypothetical protein